MPAVVYGHCDAVQHGRVTMAGLGRVDHGLRKMMELGSSGGELVSLAVELFGYRVDESEVNANLAQVAGHFFDAEHVGLGENAPDMVQRSACTP